MSESNSKPNPFFIDEQRGFLQETEPGELLKSYLSSCPHVSLPPDFASVNGHELPHGSLCGLQSDGICIENPNRRVKPCAFYSTPDVLALGELHEYRSYFAALVSEAKSILHQRSERPDADTRGRIERILRTLEERGGLNLFDEFELTVIVSANRPAQQETESDKGDE